jgi:LmbE family N-acetylglucosaminyl deacetylase
MPTAGTDVDEIEVGGAEHPDVRSLVEGSTVAGPGRARRLLGVFAHPDDEVFCAGGTMAQVAKAGGQVVILSATHGERGQIREAAAATRRTLGAVREAELRASAAELGVSDVRVLDFGDGTLPAHRSAVAAAITESMRQIGPDAVVTFAPDGGYGHPDHVVISDLTGEAFHTVVRERPQGQRLYHAVFPPRRTSMAEELARWLVEVGPPAVRPEALRAIALFAGESSTMRLARDDVRVEWFPPGVYVIEQGEPADALYLILNGTVEVIQERPTGELVHLRRMGAGEFFGELGLVRSAVRSANVVAAESLTCLVLSRTPVTAYDGRGAGPSTSAAPPAGAIGIDVTPSAGRTVPREAIDPTPSTGGTVPAGTIAADVTPYLDQKLNALAQHRTQYPIVQSVLPRHLLGQMLGTEFFRCAATAAGRAQVGR